MPEFKFDFSIEYIKSIFTVYQEKILPHSTLSRESQLSTELRSSSDINVLKRRTSKREDFSKRRSTIDNPLDRRALSRLSRVTQDNDQSSRATSGKIKFY